MEKFTIITPPQFEARILRELGKARAVQLKKVSGSEFDRLKKTEERDVDFKDLYDKYIEEYRILENENFLDLESVYTDTDKLRDFTEDPKSEVDSILTKLKEIQEKIKEAKDKHEEKENRIVETRARLESVRALQPEELKKCLTVGLVDLEVQAHLGDYLKRFDDLSTKIVEISQERSFIFVFGPEQRREWVETIFLIFDVEDIFDVLNTRDILLAIDAGRREEVIKEYEDEIEELQASAGEGIYDQIKKEYAPILGEAKFIGEMLRILSDESIPILRTNVISVIQGWIPDEKTQVLDSIINNLQEETGELFFLQYEKPGHEDHEVPTPEPVITPSLLQPAWTLTTLRGWPSVHEVNPSYITIFIFSFQFGLMFGDIGQGAIFLLIGLFLTRKFKKGMPSKLGGLFIPMGVSAIIFGVLYDSIFLMEGLLFHHHQIMPSPVHDTTKLMLLVFQIAAIEVIFGLVLGAINQIKSGNPIGALGEHGLGMILYVAGLYLTAIHFIKIGMNFMAALSHWTFYLAIAGIFLSFLEPIIHSIATGHGMGMEVIGEGIAGLLMVFVEGLANLFSFLRIAAFALAHASLAIAAEALSHSLGIAGIGLVIMNIIALTFEFVSSSVQSLRLLYYEFMGKFFHGEGVRFKPYRFRTRRKPIS